jgi:translation initiation factor IF-2
MQFSKRLATWQVLAIGLLVFLGVGLIAVQAQDQCPKQNFCPAPVLEKPQVPPADTCCPVDPKEVKRAAKEAEHAQHEAAEACKKQQKAIAKAQHELDEEMAEQQAKIDKANAHAEHERSEWYDALAKEQSFPTETVAETKAPEPEICRTKPEPAPVVEQPAPVIIEKEVVVEAPPAPAPAPEPAPAPAPEKLPKTASPMDLIGLIGLVSMTGGFVRRFRR